MIVKKGAKLGIHEMNIGTAWVNRWKAAGLSMPLAKSVGSIGNMRGVHDFSPDTVTFGRFEIEGYIGEGANGLDEIAAGDVDGLNRYADELMRPIERELIVNPASKDYINFWEVINEPTFEPLQGWINLAELMIICMQRAEALGIKLAIFAFNLGEPEWYEMQAIVETGVFGVAKAGGHVLSYHDGAFGNSDITRFYGGAIPADERTALLFRDAIERDGSISEMEGDAFIAALHAALGDDAETLNLVQLRGETLVHYRNANLHDVQQIPAGEYAGGALAFRMRYLYHLLKQRDEEIMAYALELYLNYEPSLIPAATEWWDGQAARYWWNGGGTLFTLVGDGTWPNQDYQPSMGLFLKYAESVKGRVNATIPAVEEPVMSNDLEQLYDQMLAEPSRVAVPKGAMLAAEIKRDGLNVASSEMPKWANGKKYAAMLASDDDFTKYALYAYPETIVDGEPVYNRKLIEVHDPNALRLKR